MSTTRKRIPTTVLVLAQIALRLPISMSFMHSALAVSSRASSAFALSRRSGTKPSILSQPLTMDSSPSFGGETPREQGESSSEGTSVLRPLVVCGPSGVGKGTIISRYMERFGGTNHFGFTVSHTTRQPREGEINGVHYHFVQFDRMKNDIDHGLFIEHAEVHGNLYGTSFDAMYHVERNLGKICLLDIDTQGVRNIKERQRLQQDDLRLRPSFIFIAPPSMEELKQRLMSRGTETDESLERRTANAAAEMEYGMAEGNFDSIIINEDLERACQDFDAAVKSMYSQFS